MAQQPSGRVIFQRVLPFRVFSVARETILFSYLFHDIISETFPSSSDTHFSTNIPFSNYIAIHLRSASARDGKKKTSTVIRLPIAIRQDAEREKREETIALAYF